MSNSNDAYELAVTTLLPLDHDRYKSYFTQFTVLHLGLFTAISSDKLAYLTPLFSFVGVLISIVWLFVLIKINSDIKYFWEKIENFENKRENQSIKLSELRSKSYSSGKLMLSIPIIFGFVHIFIALALKCS